ncbi:MAG: hypothetical protein J7496_08515 [Novosphingobium sp.]|nr:hypothetical protein [Novosphingobium sp.]
MSFSDAILALGVAAALIGAVARNVTAMVLLCSFAFSTAICALGVDFNFILWVSIDLAVVLCIIGPAMRHRDLVILGLFLPVWLIYLIMPSWGAQAVDIIVALQMLITFPARRTWRASRVWVSRMRDDTAGMECAAA